MVLTAGNVTIKLAAGNYAHWNTFWDDLGNLTGDINCTVDASAFTENTAPDAVTESLNNHTLHVLPTSFPTKTDTSDGARFTCSFNSNNLDLQMEGGGDVIIEGLVFIGGGTPPWRTIEIINVNTEFNLTFRRNIMKGGLNGIEHFDLTMNAGTKIYNNIVYDCTSDVGIAVLEDIPDAIIANNTVHNCGDGFKLGNEDVTLENNLSYVSLGACFLQLTLATGNNNADSDNTGEDADWGGGGANNVPGIGDPFNNLAADDYTITAEGVIGKAGKDLSGDFTDDFFGVIRSNWTIGACEFISPLGPANLKSCNAVTKANIKSINAVLIADVKSINAIA